VTAVPSPLAAGLWGILATPFSGPDLEIDESSLRREVALFREIGATGSSHSASSARERG
jgi:4-hydroxy-tetrahydrodipicolinate synthase